MTLVGGAITFIDRAMTFIGRVMTFIGRAMTFIGKGSSAIERRLFRAAESELYCCWAGCRGLYKLGCCGSLALVKGKSEASRAYMGRACADRACAGGACAGGAACWGTDDIEGVNERDLRW